MTKAELLASLAGVNEDDEIRFSDGLPITGVVVAEGVVYLSDFPLGAEDGVEASIRLRNVHNNL